MLELTWQIAVNCLLAGANAATCWMLIDRRQPVARRVASGSWGAAGLLHFLGLGLPAVACSILGIGALVSAHALKARWVRHRGMDAT